MQATRERPIIFSSPMVRAILDGRKTMTRRVMKPQPTLNPSGDEHWWPSNDVRAMVEVESFLAGPDKTVAPSFCPYGAVGDRLWVRESWCLKEARYGPGTPDDCWYAADGQYVRRVDGDGFQVFRKDGTEASPWVPSIHMPRWASRLTLEIADVRVERLQTITEEDALAEGGWTYATCPIHKAPERSFAVLWDSINGKRTGCSWADDPWLWVISFNRLEAS